MVAVLLVSDLLERFFLLFPHESLDLKTCDMPNYDLMSVPLLVVEAAFSVAFAKKDFLISNFFRDRNRCFRFKCTGFALTELSDVGLEMHGKLSCKDVSKILSGH